MFPESILPIWPQTKEIDMDERPLCACGCGNPVSRHYAGKKWNKYIHGHNSAGSEFKRGRTPWNKGLKGVCVAWNKGIPWSDEAKKKMSESHKGQPSHMKGKHLSKEHKRKLSESHKGQVSSRKGLTKHDHPSIARQALAMVGNKNSLGRIVTDEVKAKISKANSGANNGMYGKRYQHSEETKRKISIANLGERNGMFGVKGPAHSNWKGGTSLFPYPIEWNEKFKQKIRDSQGNCCQLCGKTSESNGRQLALHHINGVKDDLSPSNLMTLCATCHSLTIQNTDLWQAFFEGEQYLQQHLLEFEVML